ncbi:hypothetical protein BpHYR1_003710 [Brachionus plicatilis]|uniref:Uncharacterized protein n=1 Tax=Brachionus plicatilis TaxID=10195 RepID=A0A3M7PQW7_BRAPC|nr:hypothetical protein BpHYR1_003710 [Brachionus plicatilis]
MVKKIKIVIISLIQEIKTIESGYARTNIERSEVLQYLFIPICSCQEHELIIKSRCELSA